MDKQAIAAVAAKVGAACRGLLDIVSTLPGVDSREVDKARRLIDAANAGLEDHLRPPEHAIDGFAIFSFDGTPSLPHFFPVWRQCDRAVTCLAGMDVAGANREVKPVERVIVVCERYSGVENKDGWDRVDGWVLVRCPITDITQQFEDNPSRVYRSYEEARRNCDAEKHDIVRAVVFTRVRVVEKSEPGDIIPRFHGMPRVVEHANMNFSTDLQPVDFDGCWKFLQPPTRQMADEAARRYGRLYNVDIQINFRPFSAVERHPGIFYKEGWMLFLGQGRGPSWVGDVLTLYPTEAAAESDSKLASEVAANVLVGVRPAYNEGCDHE